MNRESYDAVASDWDAARRAFYGREQAYVDVLLDGLSPPGHILDLGCGTGRPIAEYVLARGHRVTGVDQSVPLLDRARRRFPHATWIEATIESFTTTERFAAIVCWDALFHIERVHHEGIVARCASMLSPAGRLMLTCGGSEHPAFTDTMFGRTFFYDSHPPERMLAILDHAGFRVLLAEFMNEPTPGRDKGRYAVVAERRPG